MTGGARPADVARAVGERLGGGLWRAVRAARGSSGRSFLVSNATRRLFVKLEVRVDLLHRLGEIGVAPPVVASGELAGRAFVVQELSVGRRPSRAWFGRRLDELADLMGSYQRDAALRPLLEDHAVTAVQYGRYLALRAARQTRDENAAAFVAVGTRVGQLPLSVQTDELAPTHGDPNTENFLVGRAGTHLVDWDDAALMDPMRDIGQLLWWYVPPEAWPRFFDRYGIEDDPALRDRLYWWVAAESLDVALRLDDAGDGSGARAFLTDAAAALAHRPNPRAG